MPKRGGLEAIRALNIYGKLKVDSRSEAVAVAIEQGIIHVEK